jgi:hypothetical protein
MDPCFIDIKVKGRFHRLKAIIIAGNFFKYCLEKGIKTDFKSSFGFFHPNTILISIKDSSSIRINPGLNPEANAVIIEYLKSL